MTATILTHCAAAAFGAAMWNFIVIWEGRRLMREDETANGGAPQPTVRAKQKPRWIHRRPPYAVVALLIAASVLIGLAIQQTLYQRSANEQEACYNSWGEELSTTITTRTDANIRLQRASRRREEAVDNIILIVIALRRTPPEAADRDLTRVLAQFAQAKQQLDKAQRSAVRAQTNNPYPLLDCD